MSEMTDDHSDVRWNHSRHFFIRVCLYKNKRISIRENDIVSDWCINFKSSQKDDLSLFYVLHQSHFLIQL
jgi:hypothetical protein